MQGYIYIWKPSVSSVYFGRLYCFFNHNLDSLIDLLFDFSSTLNGAALPMGLLRHLRWNREVITNRFKLFYTAARERSVLEYDQAKK